MPKQLRDNNYYLQRLKTRDKGLYKKVMAGEVSVTKARQLAGLGGTRTRLGELKNSWSKATTDERTKFLAWTGHRPSGSPTATPAGAFDTEGLMRPWASKRIAHVLAIRGIKMGDLSEELGLKRLDASVGKAMKGSARVKGSTRIAVEKWLKKNARL